MTRKTLRPTQTDRSRRLTLERLERRDVPSFGVPQAFLAGLSPSDVVNDDFNGDGFYDLAVTNEATPGTVSVLLNTGNGTFGAPKSFPTGGNKPTSLVVVDVSGDGRADLVVTNNNFGSSDTVAVLRGSGTGLFRRPVTFAAGINPTSVGYSEFNGDAIVDLVVANEETGKVTVLFGQIGGAFTQSISYDVGTKVKAVSTGDFNGDGLSDLVAVGNHTTAPKTAILLSNGNGTFSFGPQYSDGIPIDISVADYNADFILDLAVASEDDTVIVRLGNGDGTFALAGIHPTAAGLTVVDTEDIDSDGNLDFLALTAENGFTVFLGQGDGNFVAGGPYAAGIEGAGAAVRDFTGDGIPDVAVANNVYKTNPVEPVIGTVTLQRGLVGGAFLGLPPVIPASVTYFYEMVTSDFNSDGDVDLAISSISSSNTNGSLNVLLGGTGGTFQAPLVKGLGKAPRGLAAADFNNDGEIDVAVGVYFPVASEGVEIALGNGDGTFQSFQNHPIGTRPLDVIAGDFDADGNIDVATANTSSSVSLLLGNGDGTFKSPVNFGVGPEATHLVAGDFNGDGILDLATANAGSMGTGNTASVLLGNGDGTFKPKVDFVVGLTPEAVTAADLNGDGKLDLAVANSRISGTVNVLRGNGDGTFEPAVTYTVGTYPGSLAAADVNGDGIVDLATRSKVGGTISLLLGKADGTFEPLHHPVGSFTKQPFYPAPLVLADFDGDGWQDIAAAKEDSVAVLMNDGIWPPLPISDGPGVDVELTRRALPSPITGGNILSKADAPKVVADETCRTLVKFTSTRIRRMVVAETKGALSNDSQALGETIFARP